VHNKPMRGGVIQDQLVKIWLQTVNLLKYVFSIDKVKNVVNEFCFYSTTY